MVDMYRMSGAYALGFTASREGRGVQWNPYVETDSDLRAEWLRGWNEAHDIAQPRRVRDRAAALVEARKIG
jgi:ribosome modulation factor